MKGAVRLGNDWETVPRAEHGEERSRFLVATMEEARELHVGCRN